MGVACFFVFFLNAIFSPSIYQILYADSLNLSKQIVFPILILNAEGEIFSYMLHILL